MFRANPTDQIDVNFMNYVQARKSITDAHMEGGIPDYAFATDYSLRQKMKGIPGLVPLFKALTTTVVPRMKQQYYMHSMKVGVTQFPEIHNMTLDCARRLGIGVPTVFIENKPGELNAFTMATEDDYPIIILNSSLVERFSPSEVKAIIGHECGHIHNNHSIYNYAAQIIINASMGMLPIAKELMQLISLPITIALKTWSRAAEVSCDRAGMICADNLEDNYIAHAKLAYGAMFSKDKIDIEAFIKQYENIRSTPVRFMELFSTHPTGVRRILALREFANSEVFYKWRPEYRQPGAYPVHKQELDERCDRVIAVSKR